MKCSFCDQIFTDRDMVRQHEDKHIENGDIRKYTPPFDMKSKKHNKKGKTKKKSSRDKVKMKACSVLLDRIQNEESDDKRVNKLIVRKTDSGITAHILNDPTECNKIKTIPKIRIKMTDTSTDTRVDRTKNSPGTELKITENDAFLSDPSDAIEDNLEVSREKTIVNELSEVQKIKIDKGASTCRVEVSEPCMTVNELVTDEAGKTDIQSEFSLDGRDLSLEYGQHYCSVCSKKFDILARMMVHRLIHTKNNKVMRCIFCGKVFRTRVKLFDHALAHTGEKPYGCSYCHERFMELAEIKAHGIETGHVFKTVLHDGPQVITSSVKKEDCKSDTSIRLRRTTRKSITDPISKNKKSNNTETDSRMSKESRKCKQMSGNLNQLEKVITTGAKDLKTTIIESEDLTQIKLSTKDFEVTNTPMTAGISSENNDVVQSCTTTTEDSSKTNDASFSKDIILDGTCIHEEFSEAATARSIPVMCDEKKKIKKSETTSLVIHEDKKRGTTHKTGVVSEKRKSNKNNIIVETEASQEKDIYAKNCSEYAKVTTTVHGLQKNKHLKKVVDLKMDSVTEPKLETDIEDKTTSKRDEMNDETVLREDIVNVTDVLPNHEASTNEKVIAEAAVTSTKLNILKNHVDNKVELSTNSDSNQENCTRSSTRQRLLKATISAKRTCKSRMSLEKLPVRDTTKLKNANRITASEEMSEKKEADTRVAIADEHTTKYNTQSAECIKNKDMQVYLKDEIEEDCHKDIEDRKNERKAKDTAMSPNEGHCDSLLNKPNVDKSEANLSEREELQCVERIITESETLQMKSEMIYFKKTKREPDSLFEQEVVKIMGQKRKRRAPSLADQSDVQNKDTSVTKTKDNQHIKFRENDASLEKHLFEEKSLSETTSPINNVEIGSLLSTEEKNKEILCKSKTSVISTKFIDRDKNETDLGKVAKHEEEIKSEEKKSGADGLLEKVDICDAKQKLVVDIPDDTKKSLEISEIIGKEEIVKHGKTSKDIQCVKTKSNRRGSVRLKHKVTDKVDHFIVGKDHGKRHETSEPANGKENSVENKKRLDEKEIVSVTSRHHESNYIKSATIKVPAKRGRPRRKPEEDIKFKKTMTNETMEMETIELMVSKTIKNLQTTVNTSVQDDLLKEELSDNKTALAKSKPSRKARKATCNVCGKQMASNNPNALRLHMRSHKNNVSNVADHADTKVDSQKEASTPETNTKKHFPLRPKVSKPVNIDESPKEHVRSKQTVRKTKFFQDADRAQSHKSAHIIIIRHQISSAESKVPANPSYLSLCKDEDLTLYKKSGSDSIETSGAEEDSEIERDDIDSEWNATIWASRIPKRIRHQPVKSYFGCGHRGLPNKDRRKLFQESIHTLSRRILGWRGHLKTRVKLRHGTAEYPFVCHYCCVKYKQVVSLVAHMKRFPSHASENKHLSDSLDLSQPSPRLRKPESCQVVQRRCSDRGGESDDTSNDEDNSLHKRTGSKSFEAKIITSREKFTCGKCGKDFSFRCNLRRHEQSHERADKQEAVMQDESKFNLGRKRPFTAEDDEVAVKKSLNATMQEKETEAIPPELNDFDHKDSDSDDSLGKVVTIVTKRTQLTEYLPEKNKRIPDLPTISTTIATTVPTAPIACKQMPATIVSPNGQIIATNQTQIVAAGRFNHFFPFHQ